MKIAHFSWESLHSIAIGGVAAAVTELAAAQARKGHEVHVFTRPAPGQPYFEEIHGVRYHRCPHQLHPNLIDEMGNMSRSLVHHFFETEKIIGGFDICHFHDWHVVDALHDIKNAGRRCVFTLHSTEYGRCGNNHFNGRSDIIKGKEGYGAHKADRVIACSFAMKGEIEWLYGVPHWKTKMVRNGISAHQYNGWLDPAEIKARYQIGPLDPTVLFVGRMYSQKGPDLLVEAIRSVLNDKGNAKFVFAGDGPMKNDLQNRANQLGVGHAARFLGYVDEGVKRALLKSCDCVVLPSRNEPFGIVALEAWASGKPVVALHGTGTSELIWEGVTGLKAYHNPESIAWAVKNLFHDHERARWMGRNGRHGAETEYSWDKVAGDMLGVYGELF